ncbi:hypothetical protein PV326_013210 [Microctonus aethiopoides]|nr:hypothetical protein PV326_013210 [Microctonus aethiopoides]
MSLQSADINNKKIMVLTNTSKYKSFIFDVELEISCTADSVWDRRYMDRFIKTLSTTIACQIGHKYKQWKVSTGAIACKLNTELSLLSRSQYKLEGTCSVGGQYIDNDSDDSYSEMIYDWFTYNGCLAVSKDFKIPSNVSLSNIYLQYTIRFFLGPALPIAQDVYCTRRYPKVLKSDLNYWTDEEEVINWEMEEYNHCEVWQAVTKSYLTLHYK